MRRWEDLLLCRVCRRENVSVQCSDANGINFLERNEFLKKSRGEMNTEIALAIGPCDEIIRQADIAIDSGEIEKAVELYFGFMLFKINMFRHIYKQLKVIRPEPAK